MTSDLELPVLSQGSGSRVVTEDGRHLVDLALGFGAAFLGHAHPAVTRGLQEQAARLLSSGRNPTALKSRVDALLATLLSPGLSPGGLYSTGMEVAEFAMRVAAAQTGRREFAGFARSMHGKSAMTAALCWGNAPLRPDGLHMLPFVANAGEGEILEALSLRLRTRRVAALFVEPIQGSNAAHEASTDFYRRALDLCREHGTLCVFDETLTGLYRTGTPFYADRMHEPPDLLIFAKSLGNGFPVSALALGEAVEVRPEALPHSTFSCNPLALAAVEATLAAMGKLRMEESVASIEAVVRSTLGRVGEAGVTLRGRGAMWCLEFRDALALARARTAIGEAGILVTSAGSVIRLLPAATIEPQLLRESCDTIAQACISARG